MTVFGEDILVAYGGQQKTDLPFTRFRQSGFIERNETRVNGRCKIGLLKRATSVLCQWFAHSPAAEQLRGQGSPQVEIQSQMQLDAG